MSRTKKTKPSRAKKTTKPNLQVLTLENLQDVNGGRCNSGYLNAKFNALAASKPIDVRVKFW